MVYAALLTLKTISSISITQLKTVVHSLRSMGLCEPIGLGLVLGVGLLCTPLISVFLSGGYSPEVLLCHPLWNSLPREANFAASSTLEGPTRPKQYRHHD